jgi:hypothetical protein
MATSPPEQRVQELHLELAADSGDPSPRRVQHITCTRSKANRVMCGDVVPGWFGPGSAPARLSRTVLRATSDSVSRWQ